MSKFYKPVMGGIEKVAWELAEGLRAQGLRSDVLCSNQQLHTLRDDFEGYQVVRASSLGMLLSTSMAPAMVRELRRMAAASDLIHLHMPDPMAALAVWLVRPRVPLVVHWHSDVIRQRRAMRLYQPLQSWLLHRADAIIATSQPYAESSLPLQPWRSKVRVIPIGISDLRPEFDAAAVAALRRQFGDRRIVFALGRMAYYKGFEVLIAAAAQLPDDTVVVIGGDGELLQHFRGRVAELGLGSKVRLPGPIGDHELPLYFAACEIFCMPSTVRSEAYGVAIVEAMAMGRPVVASDIDGSGVPWVNQHGLTGLNAPAADVEALARALGELLRDPVRRRRMGEAGRERFSRHFTAHNMTCQIIDLYHELL